MTNFVLEMNNYEIKRVNKMSTLLDRVCSLVFILQLLYASLKNIVNLQEI